MAAGVKFLVNCFGFGRQCNRQTDIRRMAYILRCLTTSANNLLKWVMGMECKVKMSGEVYTKTARPVSGKKEMAASLKSSLGCVFVLACLKRVMMNELEDPSIAQRHDLHSHRVIKFQQSILGIGVSPYSLGLITLSRYYCRDQDLYSCCFQYTSCRVQTRVWACTCLGFLASSVKHVQYTVGLWAGLVTMPSPITPPPL